MPPVNSYSCLIPVPNIFLTADKERIPWCDYETNFNVIVDRTVHYSFNCPVGKAVIISS